MSNPSYFSDLIMQALSSDKRAIAFLLGAGCPLSVRSPGGTGPLIPDIAGLTSAVAKKIRGGPNGDAYDKLVNHFNEDGVVNPNIEQILTHIRALLTVVGNASVRDLDAPTLADLDSEVCANIVDLVSQELPNSKTPYNMLAHWVQSIKRQEPLSIFTTNYDTLVEQALERHHVPFFDGFTGSVRPFFDVASIENSVLPPEWTRVWKLHGSVNWSLLPDGTVVRADASGVGPRRLIYPSHLKYDQSRRMPYLALMDRLRSFFQKPASVLITAGYSFGDQHLNEMIGDGLRINSNAAVFALMYSKVDSYPAAIALAKRHSNLVLLCRDGCVAGKNRSEWSPLPPTSGTAGPMPQEFKLGDFSVLCEFLERSSGVDYPTHGAAHA